MKCQPKANNNREAVVVCARHVVKRPSKRMRASSKENELITFDVNTILQGIYQLNTFQKHDFYTYIYIQHLL